jgi:hypothetical protein
MMGFIPCFLTARYCGFGNSRHVMILKFVNKLIELLK